MQNVKYKSEYINLARPPEADPKAVPTGRQALAFTFLTFGFYQRLNESLLVILSDRRESKDASNPSSLHLERAMSDPSATRSRNGESRDPSTNKQDFSTRSSPPEADPPSLKINCVQIALIPAPPLKLRRHAVDFVTLRSG